MGKTREDGVGNGQAAWNTLEEKYNSHTKEARRAYHEKLHSTKIKSGDDPDDFLYTMDGFRERLEDMGQPVPDERYEDIILQAIPIEYERVRTASYERRDFHLADIRRMMSALYTDCLSRPNNSPLVAGRGVAMQAAGETTAPSSVPIALIRVTTRKMVSPGLRPSAKIEISKRLVQHR